MGEARVLAGVLPVVQTPFRDDDTIDNAALEVELHWVLDQGVAGLTTGMVSELLRLDEAERRHLTEAVVTAARARGALSVISCGAESTRGAIERAHHAEARGADAVMAVAPLSVALDDDALFAYYSAVADATSIGLVVQDASSYVGQPLSLTLQLRLLEAYGPRIYFKPEAPPVGQRISQMRAASQGGARVFEGLGGGALVDGYRRGVVGSMPGAEVCWAVQAMWIALEAGDWDRAYEINGPLSLLLALQTSLDSFVAVEKYLLRAQGIFASTRVRAPAGYVLDDESRVGVDTLLKLLRRSVASR